MFACCRTDIRHFRYEEATGHFFHTLNGRRRNSCFSLFYRVTSSESSALSMQNCMLSFSFRLMASTSELESKWYIKGNPHFSSFISCLHQNQNDDGNDVVKHQEGWCITCCRQKEFEKKKIVDTWDAHRLKRSEGRTKRMNTFWCDERREHE